MKGRRTNWKLKMWWVLSLEGAVGCREQSEIHTVLMTSHGSQQCFLSSPKGNTGHGRQMPLMSKWPQKTNPLSLSMFPIEMFPNWWQSDNQCLERSSHNITSMLLIHYQPWSQINGGWVLLACMQTPPSDGSARHPRNLRAGCVSHIPCANQGINILTSPSITKPFGTTWEPASYLSNVISAGWHGQPLSLCVS